MAQTCGDSYGFPLDVVRFASRRVLWLRGGTRSQVAARTALRLGGGGSAGMCSDVPAMGRVQEPWFYCWDNINRDPSVYHTAE